MKKLTGIVAGIVCLMLLGSCFGGHGMQQGGEVVGVSGKSFVEPTPYGMVKVEKGFLRVGLAENDTLWGADVPSKEISVDGFWMDQKEITNSQYRQFVLKLCFSGSVYDVRCVRILHFAQVYNAVSTIDQQVDLRAGTAFAASPGEFRSLDA